MIDHKRLLVIADDLIGRTKAGAPNQTALRRAISTAYYALFHYLLSSAADSLVGKRNRNSSRYGLVYRAFDHGRMRQVCQSVDKPVLGDKEKLALGVVKPSQEIRNVASAFVLLQQRRHWADYSPVDKVGRSDAIDLVNQAEFAINQLDNCDKEQRSNFLVFLMTSSRDGK